MICPPRRPGRDQPLNGLVAARQRTVASDGYISAFLSRFVRGRCVGIALAHVQMCTTFVLCISTVPRTLLANSHCNTKCTRFCTDPLSTVQVTCHFSHLKTFFYKIVPWTIGHKCIFKNHLQPPAFIHQRPAPSLDSSESSRSRVNDTN